MGDEAQARKSMDDMAPLPPLPSTSMFNPAFAFTSSANPALPQKLGTSMATGHSAEASPETSPQTRHVAAPVVQQRVAAAPPPAQLRAAAPPPPPPISSTSAQPAVQPLSSAQQPFSAQPAVSFATIPKQSESNVSQAQRPVIEPRSYKKDTESENWWDTFSRDFLGGLDCCAPPDRHKKSDRRQAMCGVGLVLKEVGYGELMVDQVTSGSPSAGHILPGDEITEIDDTYVYRKRKDLVQGLLMGGEGTRVSISVKRMVGGKEESIKVQLIRAK